MAGDEEYQSLRSFLRSLTKENTCGAFFLFHSLRRTLSDFTKAKSGVLIAFLEQEKTSPNGLDFSWLGLVGVFQDNAQSFDLIVNGSTLIRGAPLFQVHILS